MLDSGAKGYLEWRDFATLGERIIAAQLLPEDSPKAKAIRDGHWRYWSGLSPDGSQDGQVTFEQYAAKAHTVEWFRDCMLPCAVAVGEGSDHDDDGLLERWEWLALLTAIGFPEPDAAALFDKLDEDGDNRIGVSQWLQTTQEFYTGSSADFAGDVLIGND